MASIENAPIAGNRRAMGMPKAKKYSTRVDMTPMVDLGFLLITFFIFTATMSNPTTMKLMLPHDDNGNPPGSTAESGVLTIILDSLNKMFYYEGELQNNGDNIKRTAFNEIRSVIIQKKKQVIQNYKVNKNCESSARAKGLPISSCYDEKFMLLFKAKRGATYKNIVDLLDEMAINKVKRFALVPLTAKEQQLIK